MLLRAAILGGLAALAAFPRSAVATTTATDAARPSLPTPRVPTPLPPEVAGWPVVLLPHPERLPEFQPMRLRGSIEFELGPLFLLRSDYTLVANLYGFSGFPLCGQYALRGGAHPVSAIRLGARVGYTACDGGRAVHDGSALNLEAVDVSGTASAMYSVRTGATVGVQIGVDLEGGVQWTQLRLRAQLGSVALFRGAVGVRASLLLGPVVLGIAFAAQFAQWDDVARGGSTLSLAGFAPMGRLGGWF